MTNDMVWGTVNLLSNYNQFFDISSLIVARINLVFLIVDIALFIARWLVEMRQYNHCVYELILQKNKIISSLELAVINRQLDILNDEWEAQCAYYIINIIAANLLVVAFGATFLFSGPLALVFLAALSMLSNALYNTSDEYKKYKLANIAVKREVSNSELLDDEHHRDLLKELNDERSQAQIIFWKSLIYNAGATAFIITAAAISWPVACILTISYMGYRLYDSYQKYQHKDDKKQVSHDIYRLFSSDRPTLFSSDQINPTLLCSSK